MSWAPFAAHDPDEQQKPDRDPVPLVVVRTGEHRSHFRIGWDGAITQHSDTGHQVGGSAGVVCDIADDGDPAKPMTDTQLSSLRRVCEWVGVPARLSSEAGVSWEKVGETRERQLREVLLPQLGHDGPAEEKLEPPAAAPKPAKKTARKRAAKKTAKKAARR